MAAVVALCRKYVRVWRVLAAVLGGMIAIVNLGVLLVTLTSLPWKRPLFDDLGIYVAATQRLVDGGTWFLVRQLDGPYRLEHGDVLYPPVSAFFFAPWLLLPDWSFAIIPVALVLAFVLAQRPSVWVWPLLALCITDPTTLVLVMFGNPGLWVPAFIALGLRFGWPGILVLLKPSVAPFAIVGIHRRGWWAGLALLGIGSLVLLEHTLLYPRVVLDAQGGGLAYSVASLPMTIIPLVAWLGGRGRPRLASARTRVPWGHAAARTSLSADDRG